MLNLLHRNLTMQLALPMLLVGFLGIATLAFYSGSVSRMNAIEQLKESAMTRIDEYLELRAYYTDEVVEVARRGGIVASQHHDSIEGVIPIPATMIHDLSERFQARSHPLRLRLYSRHPFPNRRDRVLDDFARAAMAHFDSEPDGAFYELGEIGGARFVRVAVADRMASEACVKCHNSHLDTPRNDWALGDTRGVLEVDLNAEAALAAAGNLQIRILGLGAAVGLAIFLVVAWVMRRIGDRLQDTVELLERVAQGDLAIEIGPVRPDELGAMKSALGIAIGNMRSSFESLHLSRTLIDNAPVSILYCNRENRVVYANACCRRFFEDHVETTGVDVSQLDEGSIDFLFDDEEELHSVFDVAGDLPYRGMRSLGDEIFDVSTEAIFSSTGERSGSLITLDCITLDEHNAVKLREAVEAERESASRLREAAERDRARADHDHEIATEMRLKADRISEVVVEAAKGNLTARTGLHGATPMDQIAIDLDQFLGDLTERILQIREISIYLTQSGNQLDQVGRNLVEGARRTSNEVSNVARAWTATREEVDELGVSVNGLAESFETISNNAESAVEVAGSGVLAAKTARSAIEELDQSTKEIQAILTFIDQVADQSKLLSLNASIEAARAGETGRGFNVVAQEVKKLANQTEDATRRIAKTVSQILERGDRSVKSIHAIGVVIDEINENQGLIAKTVLAQKAAAQNVSRITNETRQRSHVIAASIEQLSLVAEATENDAGGTDREARRLLDLAKQIGDLTSRFVC